MAEHAKERSHLIVFHVFYLNNLIIIHLIYDILYIIGKVFLLPMKEKKIQSAILPRDGSIGV